MRPMVKVSFASAALIALIIAQTCLFGSAESEYQKEAQIVVTSKGSVIEFRVHNLTYAEVARTVSALSGFKIEALNIPEKRFTFVAKNCPWDTVIWGAFNNDDISVEETGPGEYRIKAKPTKSE